MNKESQNKTQEAHKVQPVKVSAEQTARNRKAAKKTAIILAVVALGFFVWSVFIVIEHAAK